MTPHRGRNTVVFKLGYIHLGFVDELMEFLHESHRYDILALDYQQRPNRIFSACDSRSLLLVVLCGLLLIGETYKISLWSFFCSLEENVTISVSGSGFITSISVFSLIWFFSCMFKVLLSVNFTL